MSLGIERALSNGLDSLLSPVGGIFLVLMVVYQTLFTAVIYTVMAAAYSSVLPGIADAMPVVLPVSTAVAGLIGFVLWVVGLALNVVVARSFVAGNLDSLAPEAYSRRLVAATLTFLVAGFLVGILVMVGFVLLVIPGLFLAVSFVFVTFFVAVEDDGVVAAMRNSWNLSKGNRFPLFALVMIVSLGFGIVNGIVGVIFPATTTAGWLVTGVMGSFLGLFMLAVLADAYVQLKGESDAVVPA